MIGLDLNYRCSQYNGILVVRAIPEMSCCLAEIATIGGGRELARAKPSLLHFGRRQGV